MKALRLILSATVLLSAVALPESTRGDEKSAALVVSVELKNAVRLAGTVERGTSLRVERGSRIRNIPLSHVRSITFVKDHVTISMAGGEKNLTAVLATKTIRIQTAFGKVDLKLRRRHRQTMVYVEEIGGGYKTEPGGSYWLRGISYAASLPPSA